MEADTQVSQLEQALLQQAETLARELLQNAESARARMLAESAEKLKLAGEHEVLAAKVEAERLVRRQGQAAETRLAAELDRLRWALTESTLSEVKIAFRKLVQGETRYLGVLEASCVASRLAPYLANRASRLIKSPKLYIADSGLAAHLAGITRDDLGTDDPFWGALLETYAAQNLASILEADWPGARLAYWHVQGRHEVDFVVEVGRDTLAIEVKATARWDDRDLAGLRAFLGKTPRCRAAILAHGGTDAVKLGERLWAAPLSLLLS